MILNYLHDYSAVLSNKKISKSGTAFSSVHMKGWPVYIIAIQRPVIMYLETDFHEQKYRIRSIILLTMGSRRYSLDAWALWYGHRRGRIVLTH